MDIEDLTPKQLRDLADKKEAETRSQDRHGTTTKNLRFMWESCAKGISFEVYKKHSNNRDFFTEEQFEEFLQDLVKSFKNDTIFMEKGSSVIFNGFDYYVYNEIDEVNTVYLSKFVQFNDKEKLNETHL